MLTVWRGSANQWDCDEMGHMNVKIYVQKAYEGLGVLATTAEMPFAFVANAPSTWIVEEQHIRFMREVLPGRPLTMEACVIDLGESHAEIYQQLLHGDGQVAAALRTRVRHANSKTGEAFPWSKRTFKVLTSLIETPPEETAPRGIKTDSPVLPSEQVTYAMVKQSGAPMTGLCVVRPDQCDVHGRILPVTFVGNTSDAVPNVLYDWRKTVAETAGKEVRMGGAVVEYRLIYRLLPRAGETLAVHSSLCWIKEKTHSLVHWSVNPLTGQVWMTSQVVAVSFDLDARKAVATSEESKVALEQVLPRGLTL